MLHHLSDDEPAMYLPARRARGTLRRAIATVLFASAGVSACFGNGATDPNANGPPVATVTVTPPVVSLFAAATSQLSATLKAADGTLLSSRTTTWTSSNNSVATVSSTGKVTGVTLGTASITATAEGKSGTADITVIRNPCTVRLSLALAQTVAGTLDSSDCAELFPVHSYSDAYTLQLSGATTVQVDLTSTALDVQLRIEQAQERTLMGQDDNSGGGTNARFIGALPAGTYIVWASGVVANATGAYSLSVKTAGSASRNP